MLRNIQHACSRLISSLYLDPVRSNFLPDLAT